MIRTKRNDLARSAGLRCVHARQALATAFKAAGAASQGVGCCSSAAQRRGWRHNRPICAPSGTRPTQLSAAPIRRSVACVLMSFR